MTNKPHSKYEHVFAVVRIDEDLAQGGSDNANYITKVLRNQEDAEREVERLNHLNQSKGFRYFWQLTRIEPST
jgi:hypothetical protein